MLDKDPTYKEAIEDNNSNLNKYTNYEFGEGVVPR